MRGLSASWRLLTAVGMLTCVLTTAVLTLRPVSLPGWLPGMPGVESGTGGSRRGPALLPNFSVRAADQALSISLPPGVDAGRYRVDAVSETNTVPPASCLVTDAGAVTSPGCRIEGLRDGISYLVSLRRVDAPDGAPTRMKHATPLPDLLRSPDVVAWYDAADYASIRPDQGGKAVVGSRVVSLRDKSARHADASQSEQGAMPVIGQLGPLPALQLGGSSVLTADERGLPLGGRPSTVVSVAALDDPASTKSCFRTVLAWGSGRGNQARILEKGCENDLAIAETFGSYRFQAPTASWPANKAAIVTAEFDRYGASVWLNHKLSYDWRAQPDTETATAEGTALTLGSVTWDARPGWLGRIGEVMIFNRALTPEERHAVEQYLAAKWQVLLVPDPSPTSP